MPRSRRGRHLEVAKGDGRKSTRKQRPRAAAPARGGGGGGGGGRGGGVAGPSCTRICGCACGGARVERARLDLAHALPRDAEDGADLLERPRAPSSNPKRSRTTSHSLSDRDVQQPVDVRLQARTASALSSGKAAGSEMPSATFVSLPDPPVPALEPFPDTRTVASMLVVIDSHPRKNASFCDVKSSLPANSSSFASRPASELMSRAAFFRDFATDRERGPAV